jgi:hypothetical protein
MRMANGDDDVCDPTRKLRKEKEAEEDKGEFTRKLRTKSS